MTKFIQSSLFIVLVFGMCAAVRNAQTTAFTYQGSLTSGAAAANGNYDFEFALFDTLAGGAQIGSTVTTTNIAVANGVFSVNLNFGSQFQGANRFLEIRVRQTGGGAFTTLAPRNPVNSSPYAVKSLTSESAINATNATTATNATQLGGVSSSQYVLTGDPRMTNSRPPTAGSGNYIQNSTSFQPSSFFVENGKAGILNALSRFELGGVPIIYSSLGSGNMYVGRYAGREGAGSGTLNSFFGEASGQSINSLADRNSLFGFNAGGNINSGRDNVVFGASSGLTVTGGGHNTLIGTNTDVASASLNYATAIGSDAVVSSSNTVVLGRPLDRVSLPGTATVGSLATQYGQLNLNAQSSNANFYMSGDGASKGINFGVDSTTTAEAKLFISQYNGVTYLDRLVINENGEVGINILGQGGTTALCRNSLNHISTCSSSIRYKSNIENFTPGLALIKKLRPVFFDWSADGTRDMGLVAEEVAETEPLLTTTNDKGEIEGVKYDRVGVVLVNAVQEQQTQIEAQQNLIETQQKQIDQLKQIVCQSNPSAPICKPVGRNK